MGCSPAERPEPYPRQPQFAKFNSETALGKLEDDIAAQIDELYKRFTTAVIPVQSFSTDDRAAVAIVFERINRLGIMLDTLQLLSAWSWSEEFDLQGQFEEIADEIAPSGSGRRPCKLLFTATSVEQPDR